MDFNPALESPKNRKMIHPKFGASVKEGVLGN